jgi:hypothetical protein
LRWCRREVEELRRRTWRRGDAAVEDELGEGDVQEGAGGEALRADEVGTEAPAARGGVGQGGGSRAGTNGGRAAAARAGGGADELEHRAAAREGEGLGFSCGSMGM